MKSPTKQKTSKYKKTKTVLNVSKTLDSEAFKELLRENQIVKWKIKKVEERIARKNSKDLKERLEAEYKSTFKYRILQTFDCFQKEDENQSQVHICKSNIVEIGDKEEFLKAKMLKSIL